VEVDGQDMPFKLPAKVERRLVIMFGLTKREQQWKAEQRIVEALMGAVVAAIQAAAQIRVEKERKISQQEIPKPPQLNKK
jgi:hypothetical protein